jgi:rubrerythrin
MSLSLDSQIASFFDELHAHPRFSAFACQVESAGYPKIAHLLRIIARSEEVRLNLIQSRLFTCAEEVEEHAICPECGLVVAGDMPEGCPLDGTPWEQFERVA